MLTKTNKRRHSLLYRLVVWGILFSFAGTTITPPQTVFAQTITPLGLNLPIPGAMVPLSPGFTPPTLTGMTIRPENPFQFDFIIDTGDNHLEGDKLKAESQKLIKYFLASLTVPEEEMWVNLSPYEKDRIIPQSFGVTEMGRDLLAQDYILKQLSVSLMYPEDDLGRKFWDRVYEKSQALFGTTEIPMNTFNKIWVVPDTASVYVYGESVFVTHSRLKVMLEEDYVAARQALSVDRETLLVKREEFGDVQNAHASRDTNLASRDSSITTEIIREILIPEIEDEVNHGKNFANLRQIYNAMILATWYKQNLKESHLSEVYVNQNKIKGVDVQDKDIKQKIYDQYLEAFKKGVYDYIKEDYDPSSKQIIPRKYFGGGVDLKNPTVTDSGTIDNKWLYDQIAREKVIATADLEAIQKDLDPAMADELLQSFPQPVGLDDHEFAVLQPVTGLDRRDGQMDIFREEILPTLVDKHKQDKKIKIAVIGAATGEEPVTVLANLIHAFEENKEWGSLQDWDISIEASEYNEITAFEFGRRLRGELPFIVEESQLRSDTEDYRRVQGIIRRLNQHRQLVAESIHIREGNAKEIGYLKSLANADIIFMNEAINNDLEQRVEGFTRVSDVLRQFSPDAFMFGNNISPASYMYETHNIVSVDGFNSLYAAPKSIMTETENLDSAMGDEDLGGIQAGDKQKEALERGARIKDLRKAKGWTLEGLSDESGVNVILISNYERGKTLNPSNMFVADLAEAFEVEPLFIYFGTSLEKELKDARSFEHLVEVLLINKGLSVPELAKEFGLTSAYIYSWIKKDKNSQDIYLEMFLHFMTKSERDLHGISPVTLETIVLNVLDQYPPDRGDREAADHFGDPAMADLPEEVEKFLYFDPVESVLEIMEVENLGVNQELAEKIIKIVFKLQEIGVRDSNKAKLKALQSIEGLELDGRQARRLLNKLKERFNERMDIVAFLQAHIYRSNFEKIIPSVEKITEMAKQQNRSVIVIEENAGVSLDGMRTAIEDEKERNIFEQQVIQGEGDLLKILYQYSRRNVDKIRGYQPYSEDDPHNEFVRSIRNYFTEEKGLKIIQEKVTYIDWIRFLQFELLMEVLIDAREENNIEAEQLYLSQLLPILRSLSISRDFNLQKQLEAVKSQHKNPIVIVTRGLGHIRLLESLDISQTRALGIALNTEILEHPAGSEPLSWVIDYLEIDTEQPIPEDIRKYLLYTLDYGNVQSEVLSDDSVTSIEDFAQRVTQAMSKIIDPELLERLSNLSSRKLAKIKVYEAKSSSTDAAMADEDQVKIVGAKRKIPKTNITIEVLKEFDKNISDGTVTTVIYREPNRPTIRQTIVSSLRENPSSLVNRIIEEVSRGLRNMKLKEFRKFVFDTVHMMSFVDQVHTEPQMTEALTVVEKRGIQYFDLKKLEMLREEFQGKEQKYRQELEGMEAGGNYQLLLQIGNDLELIVETISAKTKKDDDDAMVDEENYHEEILFNTRDGAIPLTIESIDASDMNYPDIKQILVIESARQKIMGNVIDEDKFYGKFLDDLADSHLLPNTIITVRDNRGTIRAFMAMTYWDKGNIPIQYEAVGVQGHVEGEEVIVPYAAGAHPEDVEMQGIVEHLVKAAVRLAHQQGIKKVMPYSHAEFFNDFVRYNPKFFSGEFSKIENEKDRVQHVWDLFFQQKIKAHLEQTGVYPKLSLEDYRSFFAFDVAKDQITLLREKASEATSDEEIMRYFRMDFDSFEMFARFHINQWKDDYLHNVHLAFGAKFPTIMEGSRLDAIRDGQSNVLVTYDVDEMIQRLKSKLSGPDDKQSRDPAMADSENSITPTPEHYFARPGETKRDDLIATIIKQFHLNLDVLARVLNPIAQRLFPGVDSSEIKVRQVELPGRSWGLNMLIQKWIYSVDDLNLGVALKMASRSNPELNKSTADELEIVNKFWEDRRSRYLPRPLMDDPVYLPVTLKQGEKMKIPITAYEWFERGRKSPYREVRFVDNVWLSRDAETGMDIILKDDDTYDILTEMAAAITYHTTEKDGLLSTISNIHFAASPFIYRERADGSIDLKLVTAKSMKNDVPVIQFIYDLINVSNPWHTAEGVGGQRVWNADVALSGLVRGLELKAIDLRGDGISEAAAIRSGKIQAFEWLKMFRSSDRGSPYKEEIDRAIEGLADSTMIDAEDKANVQSVLSILFDSAKINRGVRNNTKEFKRIKQFAKVVLQAHMILRKFVDEEKDLNITEKSFGDVTDADLLLNRFIMQALESLGIPIISEESPETHDLIKSKRTFITVDPIDATARFITAVDEKQPKEDSDYLTLISLIRNGKPIIGIVMNHYTGELSVAFNNAAKKKHFETHVNVADHTNLEFQAKSERKRVEEIKKGNVIVGKVRNESDLVTEVRKEAELIKVGPPSARMTVLSDPDIHNGLTNFVGKVFIWDLAAAQVFADINDIAIVNQDGEALKYLKGVQFDHQLIYMIKGDRFKSLARKHFKHPDGLGKEKISARDWETGDEVENRKTGVTWTVDGPKQRRVNGVLIDQIGIAKGRNVDVLSFDRADEEFEFISRPKKKKGKKDPAMADEGGQLLNKFMEVSKKAFEEYPMSKTPESLKQLTPIDITLGTKGEFNDIPWRFKGRHKVVIDTEFLRMLNDPENRKVIEGLVKNRSLMRIVADEIERARRYFRRPSAVELFIIIANNWELRGTKEFNQLAALWRQKTKQPPSLLDQLEKRRVERDKLSDPAMGDEDLFLDEINRDFQSVKKSRVLKKSQRLIKRYHLQMRHAQLLVDEEGNGILIRGESSTGKSALTKEILQKYKKVQYVADDLIYITYTGGQFYAGPLPLNDETVIYYRGEGEIDKDSDYEVDPMQIYSGFVRVTKIVDLSVHDFENTDESRMSVDSPKMAEKIRHLIADLGGGFVPAEDILNEVTLWDLRLPISDTERFKSIDQFVKEILSAPSKENEKKLGGIDLNPNLLDLKSAGGRIDFDLPTQPPIFNPELIEGFIPVIINITPVTNFPLLLGINAEETNKRLSYLSPN